MTCSVVIHIFSFSCTFSLALTAHSKDREARAFRPLESSYFETILLSCCNLDICKDNYFPVWYAITLRVVGPLSLATIADSIMVEVEDLNLYGVGLFDFCIDLFNIVCSIPFFCVPFDFVIYYNY